MPLTFMPSKSSEPAKSNALSKCPMFRKIGLFIIFFMWSKAMMLTLAFLAEQEKTCGTTVSRRHSTGWHEAGGSGANVLFAL